MNVEVEIALLVVYEDCAGCLWVCTSGKFNQSVLKKLISSNF